MYTATVTIKGITWNVDVATTTAEHVAGLSGLAELASGRGMLFDMGSNQAAIAINMDLMKFELDIVFISESLLVQGMLWDVGVGEQDVVATFPEGPGARYFMEVNEGELVGITFDDPVVITGYTPPAPPTPTEPIDISSLMGLMITMMIVVMMMKMMSGMMKGVGG